MGYADKLRDPRWQRRRLEVMGAADFRCRRCNSDEKFLNVHHKAYLRGRDPWDYPDQYLECLCEDCHEEATKVQGHLQSVIGLLNRDQI